MVHASARNLIRQIKGGLRSQPRVFDRLRAIKRLLFKDPAYMFLQRWSAGRKIRFLQIGASDGLRNDPFREFIVSGWRGVLVEPLPDVFELLKSNYSHVDGLVFVNAAIGRESGSLSIWTLASTLLQRLPIEERLEFQRKASFDRRHLEKFVPEKYRPQIECVDVECMTIMSLLERYWRQEEPIQLLAIDAEGHEPDIIRSIDFERFRPEVIFYESHTLSRDVSVDLQNELGRRGYDCVQILGDTAAVRRDIPFKPVV